MILWNANCHTRILGGIGREIHFDCDKEPQLHSFILHACVVQRGQAGMSCYNAKFVKHYLKNAKLSPIHVRSSMLVTRSILWMLLQYIEVYVTKVLPGKMPQVIGKLFDLGANEDFIKQIPEQCDLWTNWWRLPRDAIASACFSPSSRRALPHSLPLQKS